MVSSSLPPFSQPSSPLWVSLPQTDLYPQQGWSCGFPIPFSCQTLVWHRTGSHLLVQLHRHQSAKQQHLSAGTAAPLAVQLSRMFDCKPTAALMLALSLFISFPGASAAGSILLKVRVGRATLQAGAHTRVRVLPLLLTGPCYRRLWVHTHRAALWSTTTSSSRRMC